MFCYRCGTKFDPKVDKYCSNCGTEFLPRSPRKRIPNPIYFLFGVIVVGLLFPLVLLWLFADCGVVHVSRSLRDLEEYAGHLAQIESATINNVRPPSYMISQIDGDYSAISFAEYDGCVKPAANAMRDALYRASRFFGDLPVNRVGDDGYPIILRGEILQRKYEYENTLRLYYSQVEQLKACQTQS